MSISLNIKFEQAVRILARYIPPSDEKNRKPIMFHDIRVGVYLYENGYSGEIVLAGILHDVMEWSSIDQQFLRDEFGDTVVDLILARTRDDSIADKFEKTNELIQRCVQFGQDALIIKTADIIDSFRWYSKQNNETQLGYCMRNANAIFRFKKEDFNDKIFDELKIWRDKYAHLTDPLAG
jgi:(p)ppGpp synthase/HD superfamily hydrolase